MRSSISEQGTPAAKLNPCSWSSAAKRAPVSTSRLLRGGLDELVLLDLHLLDQLGVGRRLDDLVELGAVVRDQAHALDDHVVHEPAVGLLEHPVIDGHLGAALRDDPGAHDRLVAVQRIAEKRDLLAAVALDL